MIAIAHAFVDNQGNNPIARRTFPINEILANELLPSAKAISSMGYVASVASAVSFDAAGAGIENVRQGRLRQSRAFGQRADRPLFLKVANRFRDSARADSERRGSIFNDGRVDLRLRARQVHFLQDRLVDRAGKRRSGRNEK